MATPREFLEHVRLSLESNSFIKLSLGNYRGTDADLKNVYVKPVLIKRELRLSFVYRYQRRDMTKNYTVSEGVTRIGELLQTDGFRAATLFTVDENRICQHQRDYKWSIYTEKPSAKKPNSLAHDDHKERKITSIDKAYLHALRLTDAEGKVYKNAQDKWKQINHYIDILSTALQDLPAKEELRIVDMGAGKGYLTFALYDYLHNQLNKQARVEGVEYRQDLVDLCNAIAADSHLDKLQFSQGTIEDYTIADDLDVLIALHACDTATDDAIYKGITHHASLIVVAPCCHKQIRRELEHSKAKNDLDFMTKYGIFLERHAEMLTDSIRALLLEYCGYQTKVVQFVSDTHTPKNVMIIAVKKSLPNSRQEDLLAKLHALKSYFGVSYHHLEKLLGIH